MRRIPMVAVGALFLVLVLVVGAHARAAEPTTAKDALSTVQALYEDLDFEGALEAVQLAKQGPRTKREVVLLSLYEGILLCELDNTSQGQAAFRTALLVRPNIGLPISNLAPKIVQIFEDTRKQVMAEQPVRPPRGAVGSTGTGKTAVTTSLGKKPEMKAVPTKNYGVGFKDAQECQKSVYAECQKLMAHLLRAQEAYLSSRPPEELPAVRQLVTIGQQIRASRTPEELKVAEEHLAHWRETYLADALN